MKCWYLSVDISYINVIKVNYSYISNSSSYYSFTGKTSYSTYTEYYNISIF